MTCETCNTMDCTGCTVSPGGTAQTGVPEGVKGWCWGCFLLNWIWAIGNRTWIGLLSTLPFVGLGVAIWLGIKGRELAWKNREWESLEHFNRVQRAWTIWGIAIHLLILAGLIVCVWFVNVAVHWFLDSPHSFRIG